MFGLDVFLSSPAACFDVDRLGRIDRKLRSMRVKVSLFDNKCRFYVIGTRTLPLPKKCKDADSLSEWIFNNINKILIKR